MPKNNKRYKKSDKNESFIYSEAFPPDKNGRRKKISQYSLSHDILSDTKINPEDIIYKPLTLADIEEIENLHKEWFPIEYDHRYFQKIFINKHNSYFTIGAYYKIKNDKNEDKEIILGLAMCQFRPVSEYFIKHTSPESIEEICKNIDFNEEVLSYLNCEDYHCVYIMTIGVLDEFRRLHIGSKLINHIIEKALWDTLCIGIYLDVIYYNECAIKFYEKNNFRKATKLNNFYDLNGEKYDANVYLKIFTRKEKDYFRAKHYSILWKFISTCFIPPMNVFFKIIIFFLFFQCFRKKIKAE